MPAPSILIVTIDTLRADRLGAYGDARARTPALDAFARSGAVFERAFTVAPITLPAHASLFSGLIPPQHGVRGNGGFALPSSIPTLAEALRARGYPTGAFVGGYPVSRRFGLARGFDVYDDEMSRAAGVHYEFAERRAGDVVARALAWLRSTQGPVFVWAHFFDPHAPYDPPATERTGDAYRDEIAAVDGAFAHLLAVLDARGGPSLVVVTSDHGEAFGEHGEWSHGLFVYDTTLRIPLIVRGQGFEAGARIATPVGIEDVAATVLEGLADGPGLPGQSLRGSAAAPDASRPLYAESLLPKLDFGWSELRSIRAGSKKFIRAPRSELFDTGQDPDEADDRAALDPETARAMSASLDALLARSGDRTAETPIDPEAAERLRSLGYVQGPGGRGSGADPKDKVDLAKRIAAAAGPFRNSAEAARVYRDLVRADPKNPLLNLRLADALLRSGRARESVPCFRAVVDAQPRTADAHLGLGTALASLDDLDAAKAALEAGLKLEPENGQLHYNLGEIRRVRGDTAGARRAYEAATRDPVTAERARARLAEFK